MSRVWNTEGTEKLVSGNERTTSKLRLEFPKSDLTIYLPSGISEIFRQMVSTQSLPFLSFRLVLRRFRFGLLKIL